MPIDSFSPAYSPNKSIHRLVHIQNDGKSFLAELQRILINVGWTINQRLLNRGSLLAGNFSFVPPLQPGEVLNPTPAGCSPNGNGHIGNFRYQFYDPLRQLPGNCSGDPGRFWVPLGIERWQNTAKNLATFIQAAYGVPIDINYNQDGHTVYYLIKNVPSLSTTDNAVFGDNFLGGNNYPYDPFYNTLNSTLNTFAPMGGGWEMVSPDGTIFVEMTYRVDNLNPYAPYGTQSAAPVLRVRSSLDNYGYVYYFATNVDVYHFYASDRQLIIWADGTAGPAGRPTNILISSLYIPDDVPAFVGANLSFVLLVAGSTISYDGSYFLGDDNPYPAQVRDRLWYVRGNYHVYNSYLEGVLTSQSRSGPGPNGFESGSVAFVTRGFYGNDMVVKNGEPLIQTPWMVVPEIVYTAPSWIVGKLWNAMLITASGGGAAGDEIIIKKFNRYWHRLSSQALGGLNLNGSLWITATQDEEVEPQLYV